MTLATLTRPWEPLSYGFLDPSAKRELRRKILRAIAVPGCQMPYANREVPMEHGWGTGGLQVTLTLIKPASVIKVIDQGTDDSVNAASIRSVLSSGRCCPRYRARAQHGTRWRRPSSSPATASPRNACAPIR
jgi:alpha-D-ribose 1-methylphosphonate 5-phosphate C-P lyase